MLYHKLYHKRRATIKTSDTITCPECLRGSSREIAEPEPDRGGKLRLDYQSG